MQTVTSSPVAVNWNSSPIVEIMNAGDGYMVTVTTGDALRVVNDRLLTRPEAEQLAAQIRRQITLDAAAAAAQDNRAGRALQLLASGAVRKDGHGYQVHSQSRPTIYHTTETHCDCPDATYNKATCKHQLAVRMTERMSEADAMDADLAALRSGQPVVYLTDEDLAAADVEPMYTRWQG